MHFLVIKERFNNIIYCVAADITTFKVQPSVKCNIDLKMIHCSALITLRPEGESSPH